MLAEAGWIHYEIANWAASPRTVSRHNAVYWRNGDYAGIGAGAHGHMGNHRTMNQPSPARYIAALERNESVVTNVEDLDDRTAMGETMMLGLRLLQDGVSPPSFARRHGISLVDRFGSQLARLTSDWVARSRRRQGATDRPRRSAGELSLRGVPLSLNGSPEPEIESYNRAAKSLLGLIRGERYASRSASSRRQRAETRLVARSRDARGVG